MDERTEGPIPTSVPLPSSNHSDSGPKEDVQLFDQHINNRRNKVYTTDITS